MKRRIEFKVGDKVMTRRPDSPVMTIQKLAQGIKGPLVLCAWGSQACIFTAAELILAPDGSC